jgi:hypothetical protein
VDANSLLKVNPWPDAERPTGRTRLSITGVDEYTNLAMEMWIDASTLLNLPELDPVGDELKRVSTLSINIISANKNCSID